MGLEIPTDAGDAANDDGVRFACESSPMMTVDKIWHHVTNEETVKYTRHTCEHVASPCDRGTYAVTSKQCI